MAKTSDKKYVEKAQALRKLGVYKGPASKLTTGQKSAITRLAKKFSREIVRPENYKRLVVRQPKKYKKAGYKVAGNKVFVPKEGYDNIRVNKGTLVYERDEGNLIKRRRVAVKPATDVFEQAERALAKRKKGEYVIIKVSGYHDFSVSITSMEAFEQYLERHVLPFLQKRGLSTRQLRVSTVSYREKPNVHRKKKGRRI